ncbi:substrate-binding domain-containing protein [Streptomyces sp. NPDC048254]|uniref:substrate-binding domain-containing protein n=1 Tax=Streptomyces sp. NPDC048254 TaxID=3365525 RepID=UPI003713953C
MSYLRRACSVSGAASVGASTASPSLRIARHVQLNRPTATSPMPRSPETSCAFRRRDRQLGAGDITSVGYNGVSTGGGISIPDQVAIAGFDDIAEGGYSLPSLTTIAPDKAAIAETAVNLADRRVDPIRGGRGAKNPEPQDVRAPFTLKVRESTAGLVRRRTQ